MKIIEVKKWKEIVFDGKENKEQEVTTLNILSILVNSKDPNTMPKGLDSFRIFSRLAKAFDLAEQGGKLILEDKDYVFLKDIITTEIPSSWGRSKDVSDAIESFINA